MILLGACIQVYGLYSTFKNRKAHTDPTHGDPWNGRTLEWSTTSPPPVYNFAILPVVDQLDPFWATKRAAAPKGPLKYEDILMPKNTAIPLYIGLFSLVFGFAMTWRIYWLSIVSFIGIVVLLIIRLSEPDEHDVITAAEVKKIEDKARHG
jgi:cytochrome o ubiquinol oxidase subunit 1